MEIAWKCALGVLSPRAKRLTGKCIAAYGGGVGTEPNSWELACDTGECVVHLHFALRWQLFYCYFCLVLTVLAGLLVSLLLHSSQGGRCRGFLGA